MRAGLKGELKVGRCLSRLNLVRTWVEPGVRQIIVVVVK